MTLFERADDCVRVIGDRETADFVRRRILDHLGVAWIQGMEAEREACAKIAEENSAEYIRTARVYGDAETLAAAESRGLEAAEIAEKIRDRLSTPPLPPSGLDTSARPVHTNG